MIQHHYLLFDDLSLPRCIGFIIYTYTYSTFLIWGSDWEGPVPEANLVSEYLKQEFLDLIYFPSPLAKSLFGYLWTPVADWLSTDDSVFNEQKKNIKPPRVLKIHEF